MTNDKVPHRIHGHLLVQEFTPDGILATVSTIVPPRNPSAKPDHPDSKETYQQVWESKTWEPGQEHGWAHAIELAKHLKGGGSLDTFKPQVTQPKPEAKPEEVAGGEQHETEDDTGKGE